MNYMNSLLLDIIIDNNHPILTYNSEVSFHLKLIIIKLAFLFIILLNHYFIFIYYQDLFALFLYYFLLFLNLHFILIFVVFYFIFLFFMKLKYFNGIIHSFFMINLI